MEGLKLPFYSSTPGVLGLPSCTLPFWCPVKGCAGDVAWLSSHHCHRHMMMVTMLSWLQRARRCWLEMVPGQNIRKVLGVEGRHCWVCFQSSSSILRQSGVESTQLWYSLRLVLVLYQNDFHTLFSILKAFLTLLRWFLMSLPALPSCLAWQCYRGRWLNSSVIGRSSPLTLISEGFGTFSIIIQSEVLTGNSQTGHDPATLTEWWFVVRVTKYQYI